MSRASNTEKREEIVRRALRTRQDMINGMGRFEYPTDGAALVSDEYHIDETAIAAFRDFRRALYEARAFDATVGGERFALMQKLIADLSAVYRIPEPRLVCGVLDGTTSGASCYNFSQNAITMHGKLSIITLLHEFGHATGMNEFGAVAFSLNMFKRVFPKQFEKLSFNGHMAVKQ